MNCDQDCKVCMQDPDSKCAINNKEVWNKLYEPIYKKCVENESDKNSNCINIKKMKRMFLKKQLKDV